MNDSKPPLRVLLVDDHELIRHGLATVFAAQGVDVVGQAGTVAEALDLYAAHRPDSVVTDLQLPDGTGLDVVRSIRRTDKDVGLVVLTMHAGDEQIFAAMEAGASAFVGKDAPSSEVVKATRHAAVAPRSFMSTGLVGAMMRRTGGPSTRLSDRELEVLGLLADGPRHQCHRRQALHERVDGEVAHRADLPEARRDQPGPGPRHRDAQWSPVQHPAASRHPPARASETARYGRGAIGFVRRLVVRNDYSDQSDETITRPGPMSAMISCMR